MMKGTLQYNRKQIISCGGQRAKKPKNH